MENVKNLVRMEGYKLLCIRKALFGYLALMVFSAFAIQSAGFFFFILLYLLTYTPTAYDEQSKGEYHIGMLPVERVQVVQAKYLVSLAELVVLPLLIGLSGGLVNCLIEIPDNYQISFGVVLSLFFGGAMFVGVVMPCLLWLGSIRARYLVMTIYLLSFAGMGAISYLDNQWMNHIAQAGGIWLIPSGLAVLLFSYAVAVPLYRRRQFTS